MAKETVEVTVKFAYDPHTHGDQPANVWLHLLLWRLNVDTPIVGLAYKGTERTFQEDDLMGDLPLRLVDSIDPADLPKMEPAPDPPENETTKASIPEKDRPTSLDFAANPLTVSHVDNRR